MIQENGSVIEQSAKISMTTARPGGSRLFAVKDVLESEKKTLNYIDTTAPSRPASDGEHLHFNGFSAPHPHAPPLLLLALVSFEIINFIGLDVPVAKTIQHHHLQSISPVQDANAARARHPAANYCRGADACGRSVRIKSRLQIM